MRPRLAAPSGLDMDVPPVPLAIARRWGSGSGLSPSVRWRLKARLCAAPGMCTNVFFTLSGTSSRHDLLYGPGCAAAGPGMRLSPIRLLFIGSNDGVRLGRQSMRKPPPVNTLLLLLGGRWLPFGNEVLSRGVRRTVLSAAAHIPRLPFTPDSPALWTCKGG